MGRVDDARADRLRVGYPGVTLGLDFEGPAVSLRAASSTGNSRLAVSIDAGPARVVRVPRIETDLVLAEGLGPGPHHVDVVHRSETWQGVVTVRGFRVPSPGRVLPARQLPARRLLFIGDSVTCGEAIDREPACHNDAAGGADATQSYGMLLGRMLNAQVQLVCFGGRGLIRDWRGNRRVPNAPRFYDLALADGPTNAKWVHARYIPDVVVISLGTNDFNLDLGPFPDREELVTAYVALLRAVRQHAPAAHIFVTDGALVSDETQPERHQRTTLLAFITETARRMADPRVHVFAASHQAGDACNPHPTREQHAAMAAELLPAIRAATSW